MGSFPVHEESRNLPGFTGRTAALFRLSLMDNLFALWNSQSVKWKGDPGIHHHCDDKAVSMSKKAAPNEPGSTKEPPPSLAFLLLQAIESPVLVLDQQARIAWFNTACERLFGFTADELQGSHLWEHLVAPEGVATARWSYTECLGDHSVLDMLKKSGKPVRVRWTNRRIDDPALDTSYTVLTAPTFQDEQPGDVHEPVLSGVRDEQVRSALQESEVRFQTLFDSAAEFIFVIDPDGTIVLTNRSVTDQAGYSPDEITGQKYQRFFYRSRRSTSATATFLV